MTGMGSLMEQLRSMPPFVPPRAPAVLARPKANARPVARTPGRPANASQKAAQAVCTQNGVRQAMTQLAGRWHPGWTKGLKAAAKGGTLVAWAARQLADLRRWRELNLAAEAQARSGGWGPDGWYVWDPDLRWFRWMEKQPATAHNPDGTPRPR